MNNPVAGGQVSFGDLERARARIADHAHRTPLLRPAVLEDRLGGVVVLKPECLQRTGSFKFRGAYNKISTVRDAIAVVAFSSGNHAQGVAAAAKLFAISATIVMPEDAPPLKIARTRALGAEVVLYDRAGEDRAAIAHALVEKTGATLVAPYDDPAVIAGQGTVGLELAEDAAALAESLDQVLVPCGGGGLVAGISTALSTLSPTTRVYAVEPEGFDDTARSLATGARQHNDRVGGSICDALLVREPGEITFAINRNVLAGGLVVSDEQVRAAVAFAFFELKLVVEPGGAVALAAALSGKIETAGRRTGIILSGGNVDARLFADIIEGNG